MSGVVVLVVAGLVLVTGVHGVWGRFSPWHRGRRAGVRAVRWHRAVTFPVALLRVLPGWVVGLLALAVVVWALTAHPEVVVDAVRGIASLLVT